MGKLKDTLLYGGISREQYQVIKEDINNYNRKTLIQTTLFGSLVGLSLLIVSCFPSTMISSNRLIYFWVTVILLLMAAAAIFLTKKCSTLLEIERTLFMLSMLGVGIVLAYQGPDELSASYMVFLFAIPLILVQRPVYVAAAIVFSDVVYLLLMHGIQPKEVFTKNLANAICYGAASIANSTLLINMRVRKYQTDYLNRKLMMTDMMTDFLNRHAYNEVAERYEAGKPEHDLIYVMIDVNGLKTVNDTYGHQAGDRLIISAAECIREALGRYGKLFRMGGDEFVAVIHADAGELAEALEILQKEIGQKNTETTYTLSVAIGYALQCDMTDKSFKEMASAADKNMYQNKKEYYEKNGIDRRKRR